MWIVVVCLFVNYSVDFEFHKRLISNTAQQVFLKWRRSKSTGSFSLWRILLPSFSFFLSPSLCFVSYLSFHLSFRLFSAFLLSLCPIFLSIYLFVCFSLHLSFFLSSLSLPLLCPPIPTPPPCRSSTPSLPLSLSCHCGRLNSGISPNVAFFNVRGQFFPPAVLRPTAAPSRKKSTHNHTVSQWISESVEWAVQTCC